MIASAIAQMKTYKWSKGRVDVRTGSVLQRESDATYFHDYRRPAQMEGVTREAIVGVVGPATRRADAGWVCRSEWRQRDDGLYDAEIWMDDMPTAADVQRDFERLVSVARRKWTLGVHDVSRYRLLVNWLVVPPDRSEVIGCHSRAQAETEWERLLGR